MHVYEKVHAYIEQQGYKQVSIANKAGISPTTFSAMMKGKRIMYADDFRAICIALNVSPEKFISISDEE